MEDFKYDVALSFLVQDISLATALRDKLSESLKVFFFSHNQEELAGTDGLESMRNPFLLESRLNVVLFRESWGHTQWTGVEEAAIRDSCLKCHFHNVFFLMIEPKDPKPVWLPDTPVRFNLGEFSLEQAVGAIKARVQERGGHFEPLTPLRKADQLKAEQKYQWAKSDMGSQEGVKRIVNEVNLLMSEIERQIPEVNNQSEIDIECEMNREACVLRHQRVSMIVRWHQRYTNSLEDSGVSVEEYNGRLLFNRELGKFYQPIQPDQIKKLEYVPDISRALDYGWRRAVNETKDFIPSKELANQCLIQFLDLIQCDIMGKVYRKSPY
ncbi:MAG: hypothetical protein WAN35_06785 [Terracidiphilus sp.]